MDNKSVLFIILFSFVLMVPKSDADSREVNKRCWRDASEEDGVLRDIEWNLEEEEVFFIDFFFVSHTPWNGTEDLLNIRMDYEDKNGTRGQTDLLLVPPLPYRLFALPPPTLEAFVIHLPDLRFGWNRINLTFVEDHLEYRTLHINNITTGVDIYPWRFINLTVKGVDPFVNCNHTNGVRGYIFPSSAPPSSRVFAFFWNQTRNASVEEEEKRQYIATLLFSEDLIVSNTFQSEKNLTFCRPDNVPLGEGVISYLMRECRPGWREAKAENTKWQYIFASVEDLKEDEGVFVAKNCGFVQINVTWAGGGGWFHPYFSSWYQWPVEVFYDEIFPLEECPPYPTTLLCVDVVLGIAQVVLVALIVWYSWSLWRQKKINKKKEKEIERLKKEYVRRFGEWYINAYPGETKKFLDERRERKRQIARVRPSLLGAEENVAYDPPSEPMTTASDATRRQQRQESDHVDYNETLSDVQEKD